MNNFLKGEYVNVEEKLWENPASDTEQLQLKDSILKAVHFPGYVITKHGDVFHGRFKGVSDRGGRRDERSIYDYMVHLEETDEEGEKWVRKVPVLKIKLLIVERSGE